MDREDGAMRQSKKLEGGVGGIVVLGASPTSVSPAGAAINISIYEYKHVDTDNELNPIGANHVRPPISSIHPRSIFHQLWQIISWNEFNLNLIDVGLFLQSSDEEGNEWFYSPNGPANRIVS